MPHLLFLLIFVVTAPRFASTRRGFGPTLQLVVLGLAIEALSFAMVNWGLSAYESGEPKAWFSLFASAGLIAAAVLFAAFGFGVSLSARSFVAPAISLLSAAFLLFMTFWTWWISRFPSHNWW